MDPNSLKALQGAAGGEPVQPVIAVAHDGSPYISVYPWTSGTGFGTKYSDPTHTPPGLGQAISFSPDGKALALVTSGTFGIQVWSWSSSGFGTKYSDPATLNYTSTGVFGVDFSPDGADLACVHYCGGGNSFFSVWPWSSSGFGTIYSDPTSTFVNYGVKVQFSPDGTTIAASEAASPYIGVWPWSSGFGTKYANPSPGVNGYGDGMSWNHDGTAIAVTERTSPYVTVWPWSSGFGTKYSDPSTLPAGAAYSLKWSPDGTDVAVPHAGSPYISVYPWSSGFGTKYANPSTLPTGQGNSASFSPDGADLAVAHRVSPYISVYPWSSGFGTKYANPSTLPHSTSTTYGGIYVAFSPA